MVAAKVARITYPTSDGRPMAETQDLAPFTCLAAK
jgi:hypothetical protein